MIPREHYPDLWDVGESLAGELMQAAVNFGRAVGVALSPDGMNLITSAGKIAEQTVFHLHVHIVPRWKRDGFGDIWPTGRRYDIEDLDRVADKIRQCC